MEITSIQTVETDLIVNLDNLTGKNVINIDELFNHILMTKCFIKINNTGYISFSIAYNTPTNVVESYSTTNNQIYLTVVFPNSCYLILNSDSNYSITFQGVRL